MWFVQVFKQPPVDVIDVGRSVAKEWVEANGDLPLARREPEGKDSDSRLGSAEDSKTSPLGEYYCSLVVIIVVQKD